MLCDYEAEPHNQTDGLRRGTGMYFRFFLVELAVFGICKNILGLCAEMPIFRRVESQKHNSDDD